MQNIGNHNGKKKINFAEAKKKRKKIIKKLLKPKRI